MKMDCFVFAFACRALGEKPTPCALEQILALGVAAQCLLHGICPEISGRMQLIQLSGEEHSHKCTARAEAQQLGLLEMRIRTSTS